MDSKPVRVQMLGDVQKIVSLERNVEYGEPDNERDPYSEFQKELEGLINAHSLENRTDTPDFILAEYVVEGLRALEHLLRYSGEIALIAHMQGFHKGRDTARQWKPMETAPRDGTEILGYVGEGYVGGAVVLRFDLNRSSWLDWDYEAWEATHWMPLPSPPEVRHNAENP